MQSDCCGFCSLTFGWMPWLKQGASRRKGRLMHLNALWGTFLLFGLLMWAKSQEFTENVFAFIFKNLSLSNWVFKEMQSVLQKMAKFAVLRSLENSL